MKYKVKVWNDSIRAFQTWEYPYLETAMMMANKLSHMFKNKVFVSDGTLEGCYVMEP